MDLPKIRVSAARLIDWVTSIPLDPVFLPDRNNGKKPSIIRRLVRFARILVVGQFEISLCHHLSSSEFGPGTKAHHVTPSASPIICAATNGVSCSCLGIWP